MYQAVSAQATAVHEMFVNTLGMSSGSYAVTEAANAAAAG
jgi:PE family